MSIVTVNGVRVASAVITMPMVGAWTADVVMPNATPLANPILITVGDVTLHGTVVRQASFTGDTSARIVAGGGGWKNTLPSKGYSHPAGVKLSSVLTDAARSAGESIAVDTDRVIGTHYVREEAKAEEVLHFLAQQWWVDNDGVTRISARASSPIVTPFTVINWSGAKGQFEIATESLSSWAPGRTFSTNTVPTVQTISSVTIESSNDGKLRLHVLSADGTVERLRSDLRSLIQAEMAGLSYAGVWEYTIAGGNETIIDANPTDSRMPPITKCPMMPGLMGELVTPTPGAKCRIVFVNGSPMRPECIGIVGAPVLAKIGGGADFVALAASVLTELQSIRSQYNTHTHATAGTGTPSPPVVPMSAPSSVAATKVKVT